MTEERRDFYVYVLFRADGVTPFYVGKGRADRVDWHATACMRGKAKTIKDRVARKVVEAIGHIPYRIVFDELTDLEAQSAEAGMISAMGRRDLGTGILTNMTDGGDGIAGYQHTEEVKSAIRNTWDAPGKRERHSAQASARWQDGEFRAKHADAMAEVRSSPGYGQKFSATSRERWEDPAIREKMTTSMTEAANRPDVKAKKSAALTARWADPAAREMISEKVSAAWADPELRAAQSARSTKNQASPEYRAAMSAAVKAAKSTPEAKARHSEAMRLAWIRRRAAAEAAPCA